MGTFDTRGEHVKVGTSETLPKISAPESVSVVSFHLCTVSSAAYILHMLQVSPKHVVEA